MGTKIKEAPKKPFIGINHGTNKINLTHLKVVPMEYRPIEIHLKEDADVNNNPGFAIIMDNPYFNEVVGQISLKMLNEGLSDIGYEIIKKS